MYILPGFGGAPSPAPQEPLPDPTDEENKRKAKEAQSAAKRRKGFFSTVKTSGVGDVSEANTERKTLLGS